MEKVRCENCKCWEPVGESGRGDCKRKPPVTFEQIECCWPRTMYDDGCFDGITEEELLSE
jgi:hypothetical protein